MRRWLRPPLTPAAFLSPRDGSTHLLLGRLRGEDLIQLEGHLLPLVQEVQDGVIIVVKGHCIGCLRALAVLLCEGADSPENTDVPLGRGDSEMASVPAPPSATPGHHQTPDGLKAVPRCRPKHPIADPSVLWGCGAPKPWCWGAAG